MFNYKIDFKKYTDLGGPGFSLLVMKNGNIIDIDGFGFADIKNKTPITPETNFNIASISKMFNALGIALLEEEGKLNREDLVRDIIPSFPEYAKKIRLKHLIHHTSGIPDYLLDMCFTNKVDNLNNDKIIEFLNTKEKLLFDPGESWRYSNTGYTLLAKIIEVKSGLKYPDFIRDNIFEPLGMQNSLVTSGDGLSVNNMAKGYGGWPYFKEAEINNPGEAVFGDGGIITNLIDFSKWVKEFQKEIILRKVKKEKLFNWEFDNQGISTDYGYGWGRIKNNFGYETIGHNGAWLGFKTDTIFFKNEELWITYFSNYEGIEGFKEFWKVANHHLGTNIIF